MIALDTNILVYAEQLRRGPSDASKIELILSVMPAIRSAGLCLPIQVLAELSNVLRRRGGLSAARAQAAIASWRSFDIILQPTTDAVLSAGLLIATRYGFQTFDSIILAAAAEAGCPWLLSEDIPAGTTHAGCQVANPFLPWPPGLSAALA